MKVLAINGSPREKGNTWTLLSEILAGALAGRGSTAKRTAFGLTWRDRPMKLSRLRRRVCLVE